MSHKNYAPRILSDDTQQKGWEKLALYGVRHYATPIGFNKNVGKNGPVTQLIHKDGAVVIKIWPEAKEARSGMVQVQKAKKAEPQKRGRKSNQEKLAELKPGERLAEKGGYWLCLPSGLKTWVEKVA